MTVTGVNDDVDGADRAATISHTVAGGGYGSVQAADVSVTVTDDDTAGVAVSETSVTVDEDGGTATYTVVLTSQPSGDVTVTPTSSATGNATVSGALTFTPTNWETAQTVTVTGVNDDVDGADRAATISHTVAGGGYGSVQAADVAVTITDDDTAGVVVSETSVTVDEDGGTATYTVVLTSQPSSNVTVTPTSSATGNATVSGALTFTPTNWETAQTVTVTGVNDDVDGADRAATISHTVAGGGYGSVQAADVSVTVTDDDTAGVAVSETSVTVDEDGGTATYTVVLTSQPSGDVTVTPTSSATGNATVSGALTFTPTNWETAQTVTVTGVNDDVDGADRAATISHTVAGGGYGSVQAADVAVTITDDDTAGVVVSETSVTVDEDGGTATYTVVLTSQPSSNVTVTPTSSATGNATVSGALTFTRDNWETAQTVTVTGVNDDVDGADRAATISHTVAGGGYGSVQAADVAVTITDDDTAGVVVSETSVTVDEDGGTATYTVVLTSQPSSDVTVTPTSSATGNATVSGALTFTPTNWETAQTVTVTGVNDDVDGADRAATISHTVAGGGYGSVQAADVAVTITDDDTAGVVVSETSVTVDEDGGTATYTVVLTSQPSSNVTVTPTSSATGNATVSGALTFTPTNWETAQTVTVTGVNDDVDGADRAATISHTVAGGGYGSVKAADVSVTVTDDDTAGVVVSETSVTVDEDGGTATYTVVLTSQPSSNVTVTPTSSATGNATVSGALTFTPTNWETAQTVTVTGVDDDIDGADRSATISHTVAGGGYGSVQAADVAVTITDDDTAGVAVSETSVTVDEDGGTATYTVVLTSQPSGDVTVTPTSSATGNATVSGALTFTPTNWETAQTVTVTGVNDDVDGADRAATISHTVAGGGYGSVQAADVAVTITDDDTAGVVVSETSVTVDEDGGTATYTVVLTSQPSSDVTVTPTSSATGNATVSGALTFTPTNWETAQTVTVTGVNDDVDGADRAATISHTVAGGGYGSVQAADVSR